MMYQFTTISNEKNTPQNTKKIDDFFEQTRMQAVWNSVNRAKKAAIQALQQSVECHTGNRTEKTLLKAIQEGIQKTLQSILGNHHDIEQYALLKGWKKAPQCNVETLEKDKRCENCNG